MDVKLYAFLTSALDRSGQFHAPAAFPQAQRSQYTLNRRLSGLYSKYRRLGERKNVSHLGNRNWIPKTCYFRTDICIQRKAMASVFRFYAYDTQSN